MAKQEVREGRSFSQHALNITQQHEMRNSQGELGQNTITLQPLLHFPPITIQLRQHAANETERNDTVSRGRKGCKPP